MRILRDFFSNEQGATAVEYALIGTAIAGVISAVVFGIGTSLVEKYSAAGAAFN